MSAAREKRVIELSRPAFSRTAAEQARTKTSEQLETAIQTLAGVVAALRDMDETHGGQGKVIGNVIANQAKLKQDIAALDTKIDALDARLDVVIANQQTIRDDIAATHI